MKALDKVFLRVFVTEYYRVNFGFFLLVAGICFGFLRAPEHKALAEAFVSSSFLLLIPFTIWLVYSFKVITFNYLLLSKQENNFLFQASALPRILLIRHISVITFLQLMPALVYGLFLILIALKVHAIVSLAFIILALIILHLLTTWRTVNAILKPDVGSKVSVVKNKIDGWITKPFIWFYPEWIFRQQPLLVIGTKVFSCLLMIGISHFYLFDTYDERFMAMGCVLAYSSNLVLVFYYHRFENFHFAFFRGLPFGLVKRGVNFLITLFILSLFEFIVLLRYYPEQLHVIYYVLLILLALSIYAIGYACLFIKDITLEFFIQKVGIAAFIWIILILFKVPLPVFIAIHFLMAYIVYKKNFYTFEFNSAIGSDK